MEFPGKNTLVVKQFEDGAGYGVACVLPRAGKRVTAWRLVVLAATGEPFCYSDTYTANKKKFVFDIRNEESWSRSGFALGPVQHAERFPLPRRNKKRSGRLRAQTSLAALVFVLDYTLEGEGEPSPESLEEIIVALRQLPGCKRVFVSREDEEHPLLTIVMEESETDKNKEQLVRSIATTVERHWYAKTLHAMVEQGIRTAQARGGQLTTAAVGTEALPGGISLLREITNTVVPVEHVLTAAHELEDATPLWQTVYRGIVSSAPTC